MRRPETFRHPRYEILRLLGEGGMGKVYLARDRFEGNRSVALKLYPARSYDERLRSEFLALRELHHPSIAKALHFGVSDSDGSPFFTLEYIEGSSLEDYAKSLDESPPPGDGHPRLPALLWIFTVLSSAVAYLHRRGILHLDIKPGNILIVDLGPTAPPHPVLIDFGLVRRPSSREVSYPHGTLPYMAPEFFLGAPVGPEADVYALGATFYRVFSGRPALPGTTYESFARAHRESRPRPIPEVPPELESVILRALAKEPENRFRDAGELHRALTQPAIRRHLGAFADRSPVLFHDPDFVGRTQELEKLRAWLSGDRRKAPVFEVIGGSGFGKSRFLEKAATFIEVEGKNVLAVPGGAGGGRLSAGCRRWLSLLEERGARRTRAEAPRAIFEPAEMTAWKLLPHLRSDTFLVVDDFHRGDRADREFLATLARALRQEPQPPGGGILVSREPSEAGAETRWGPPDLAEAVELGPFTLEEALSVDLEGLDGALAGFHEDHIRRLKSRIYSQVGGHPLFYVRGLLDLAGNTEQAAQLTPASSIETQVRALRGTDAEAALCLACLERPASLKELQGILSRGAQEIEAALRRLRYAGLIALDGGRARPIHESVSREIVSWAGEETLRRMHARIARFLETAAKGTPSGEAGWHLLRAGDFPRALSVADRLIERGVSGAAREKAADFLASAAAHVGPDSERGRRYVECAADILCDLGRFEEAYERLRELVLADRERKTVGEDRVRRLRKLGSVCHRTARNEEALECLEACVAPEAESAAPAETMKARVELANLYHFLGRADSALECSMAGVRSWRKSSRARQEATLESAVHLHAILGQVQVRKLRFDEAISVLEDGLVLARRAKSRTDLAILLNNLGLAHHLAGQLETGLRIFRQAEAMAEETGDAGALVSIRSNIAQILAKLGRFRSSLRMLDEIEESPAARGSHRIRLGLAYSRGLLANLLRLDAEETWTQVEELTEVLGDAFLRRLAAIYRAEGYILQGRYSEARPLLRVRSREWKDDPTVAALKTARRAALEAMAGHVGIARLLRRTLERESPEVPAQLRAWNRYYLGLSALETGDREEARRELESAREAFRAMRHAAGEVECRLALAELSIRSGDGGSLEAAERELGACEKKRFEAPPGLPRSPRDIKLEVLRAWLELAKLLPGREGRAQRPRNRRSPRGEDGSEGDWVSRAERALGLLSRAAGEPGLAVDANLRVLVQVLAAAATRLLGDEELAHAAEERAALAREEILRRLAVRDRVAGSRQDPWKSAGLEALRPPPGKARLEERHAEALCDLVMKVQGPATGGSGKERLEWALSVIGEATGADIAEAISPSRVLARWVRPGIDASARGAGCQTLLAPAGRMIFLRTVSSERRGFSEADRKFLRAAARAIFAVPPGQEEPQEEEARAEPLSATATREFFPGSPGRDVLARAAREVGLIVTPTMRNILESLHRYAVSDLPVLITGESGTGKNLVAQLIHKLSRRGTGPFLVQNAGAVPPELFEADLFGYESGAFTGADKTRTGFLFRAAGGTFHLEEIADLPLSHQQLLLKVIEERHVRPLGASGPRPLDVRFLASTNRDIEAMVRRGEFRSDLFYRLSAARIHIPPLRERPQEIPLYAEQLWRQIAGSAAPLPKASLEELAEYEWPGNLRELVSVLRRLAIECADVPGPKEIRAVLGTLGRRRLLSSELFRSHSYEEVQKALEESYLAYLLEEHGGDLEAVARALGTSTRSVYRRFERLGLKPSELLRRPRSEST